MEKSSLNKKFLDIKFYHFETLFSRTFFLVPVFYTKMSPEKSPLVLENAWEQRMFTIMEKKRIWNIKNAVANLYSNIKEKFSQTCPHFSKTFFLVFFSSYIFSPRLEFMWSFTRDFVGSPHIILGKKVLGI